MQDPLFQLLGDGTTDFSNKVLDGTFNSPDNTDQYTQELFQALKRLPDAGNIETTAITREIFQSGWRKMKERTSAGISGIHFGHLKACALDNVLSDFESSLSNVSYISGYSPNSWKNGGNVMIHKKKCTRT